MAIDEGLDARGPATDADAVTVTFVTTPISAIKSYYVSDRAGAGRSLASVAMLALLGVLYGELPFVVVCGVFYLVIDLPSIRSLFGRRTVTAVFSPDGVRQEGAGGPRFRPWARFTALRRVGEYWVLRLRGSAMALPISSLDSEQTETFHAIARSNGLCE